MSPEEFLQPLRRKAHQRRLPPLSNLCDHEIRGGEGAVKRITYVIMRSEGGECSEEDNLYDHEIRGGGSAVKRITYVIMRSEGERVQ